MNTAAFALTDLSSHFQMLEAHFKSSQMSEAFCMSSAVRFFYGRLCCREETKALGLISVLTIRLAFFPWPIPHICHTEWWWDLQSFRLSVSGYMSLFLSSHLKFFSACFFPPLHLSCSSASLERCPMTSTQPYLTRFSYFCPFYLQNVWPTLGHVSKGFRSGPLDL